MKTVGIPDQYLDARVVRRCFLVEIQQGYGGATFYRFTNNNVGDVTVTIDSESKTFVRQHFSIGNVVTSAEQDEGAEISFLDINETMRAIAFNYDLLAWPITVWECYFDEAGAVVGTEPVIVGVADGCSIPIEGPIARFTMGIRGAHVNLDGEGPSQKYGTSCRYRRFRDAQCAAPASAYVTCGRTLSDCIARNNQARFGGFPYAAAPGAKFPWGPYTEIIQARPIWEVQR